MSYVLPYDDPELLRAWGTFEDPELFDLSSLEVLQYLETVRDCAGQWCHVFRHRCHPQTQERTYWRIPAPAGWAPLSLA